MDDIFEPVEPAATAEDLFRKYFAKVGVDRAQRVLNVLLESPFFYRDDDLDLFGTLRRNASAFRGFFETCLGWDLHVDDHLARVVKPRVHNPALSDRQRHMFHLGRRDECLLFMLLLEFQEEEADRQNVDLRRGGEVRFVLRDLVSFVFRRYRELLGDRAPTEEAILKTARSLFRQLIDHRFIAEVDREGVVQEQGFGAVFTLEGAEAVLFAMLPGLRCYRPEALAHEIIVDVQPGPKREEEQA